MDELLDAMDKVWDGSCIPDDFPELAANPRIKAWLNRIAHCGTAVCAAADAFNGVNTEWSFAELCRQLVHLERGY